MSLRKMIGMEGGVEDLCFQLRPKSIIFEGKITSYFTLYLQKGAQVMGSFESGNKHNIKDSLFRFKNTPPAHFRLKSFSHATYTWNLYSVNPKDGSEEFQDSATFDLKRTIELYEMELMEKERQIQTSSKDKKINKKVILQTWEQIKKQMRNHKVLLKCIFQRLDIQFQFQVIIKNTLDLELSFQCDKKSRLKRAKSESKDFRSRPAKDLKVKADPLIIKDPDQVTSPLIRKAKESHAREMQANNKNKNARSSPNLEIVPQQVVKRKVQKEEKKENNEEDTHVVMVMNPSGKVVELQSTEDETIRKTQTIDKDDQGPNSLYIPNKKFSMLSDIIERSHEGSSTYGYQKHSSTAGLNYPDKTDQILVAQGDQKNIVSIQSPLLNKFKTLPFQNYEKVLKFNQNTNIDLRRAQTTDKNPLDNQSSYVSNQPKSNSEVKSTQDQISGYKVIEKTSGDKNAKYVLIIAFLIILGIMGNEWFFGCKGKKCKTSTPKPKKGKLIK